MFDKSRKRAREYATSRVIGKIADGMGEENVGHEKRKRARNQAAGAVIRMAELAEETVGEPGILHDYKEAAMSASAEDFTPTYQETGGLRDANRGQMTGADSAVNLVVALVVGGLMAAFLLPIAIDEIATVDTTSWTSGAASLWEILPVMIVLAIFLFFVGMAVRRRF